MATFKELEKQGYKYCRRDHWVDLVVSLKSKYYREGGIHNGRISQGLRSRCEDFIPCTEEGINIIKEDDMRDVNFIGGEYKVVAVCYLGDSAWYHFKMDIDIEVNEDDVLVVQDINGLNLVLVRKVLENNIENAGDINKAKAWVVDKIDVSRQNARREATKKRRYILKQLEERKQAIEAVQMYEILAKADPLAKKLLKELKSLDKVN